LTSFEYHSSSELANVAVSSMTPADLPLWPTCRAFALSADGR